MESAPNPTVLILNLRDPSVLHRAHLQLLHSPKNLSGSTHPCRAVLGRACLDNLLKEPLLPPAPRPTQHHAQVEYSQSSKAGQASSAGPALQRDSHPGGCQGGRSRRGDGATWEVPGNTCPNPESILTNGEKRRSKRRWRRKRGIPQGWGYAGPEGTQNSAEGAAPEWDRSKSKGETPHRCLEEW